MIFAFSPSTSSGQAKTPTFAITAKYRQAAKVMSYVILSLKPQVNI